MKLALTVIALLPAVPPQHGDPTIPKTPTRIVETVQGRGVQVYRCAPPEGWTLQGPEAKLYSSSDPAASVAGTHSAGPTWTWHDGSAVRGKMTQKLASPDPGSVPSLLLMAEPASAAPGVLSHVAWVRRSDTHGGAAPNTGCDDAHRGAETRVPYTATYTFYTSP